MGDSVELKEWIPYRWYHIEYWLFGLCGLRFWCCNQRMQLVWEGEIVTHCKPHGNHFKDTYNWGARCLCCLKLLEVRMSQWA